jgi:pimeloyl-ACP methyl ester carboxylesterase
MQFESSGAGAPLAVVGGGLTGWASWRPLLARMPAGRRIILLQPLNVQLGLEKQPLPPGYGVNMESAALGAALDDADVHTPVDLVAWSYGALATLDFVLDHPERVRSAVLIEPPAVWVLPDHGRAHEEAARLEKLIPESSMDITLDMLDAFLGIAGFVPPGASARPLPQWSSWVGFRLSLRNTPAVFAHVDDLARLRASDRPVLLVTGSDTAPFLRDIIDTLAASLPHARTIEMPAGHAPQIVSPDRFFAEVDTFLGTP